MAPKFKKDDWVRYAPEGSGIVALGVIIGVQDNMDGGSGYYLVDWVKIEYLRDVRPPHSYFPIFGLDTRATLCEAGKVLYGKKDKVQT